MWLFLFSLLSELKEVKRLFCLAFYWKRQKNAPLTNFTISRSLDSHFLIHECAKSILKYIFHIHFQFYREVKCVLCWNHDHGILDGMANLGIVKEEIEICVFEFQVKSVWIVICQRHPYNALLKTEVVEINAGYSYKLEIFELSTGACHSPDEENDDRKT